MVTARKYLISNQEAGIFHVISKTVRRSWLCGMDSYTKKNFDHRKSWIKNRLIHLATYFGIEVCGYAVMSSHTHCILRNRPDIAKTWSSKEVARRWWYIFPKRKDDFGIPAEPTDEDLEIILTSIIPGKEGNRCEVLRERLSCISWFMRCLNENIARRANREDKCTGRFWNGRFKSIELIDQAAVLSCLAYVDLNPIHAGMAKTPETSDHTSGQDRIMAEQSKAKLKRMRAEFHTSGKGVETSKKLMEIESNLVVQSKMADWLSPIYANPLDQSIVGLSSFLNMDLNDYIKLLDWTGRQHRSDKKSVIPSDLDPILQRMDIKVDSWLNTVKKFNDWFHRVAGRLKSLTQEAKNRDQCWLAGRAAAKIAFL